MGVSITLSFRSLRRQKTSKLKIAYKIIKRSIILFGLGLFTSNCEFQFNTKEMPIWISRETFKRVTRKTLI